MRDAITKYYNDFSGGLNDTASPKEIADNEASVLANWDITYKGQLKRRPGITQVGNTFSANPVTALHSYLQLGGARDLICIEGTSIRYLNGSIFDVLDNRFVASAFAAIENVELLNKVFIASEDNNLKSWDRSSITLNASLTDLGILVPHGNGMRWHKNHMFAYNNVNVNNVKYPHEVYISNLGDPTTYDTTNNHFTVPGNGRVITTIDLGDNLVIFKERAVQYLSGFGNNSWKVTESSSNVANVDEQVGIAGPLACTRVGNEVWFLDDRCQVRRIYQTDFDAFRKDIISKNIQGTLAKVNRNALSQAAMWTHNDKVYLALPTNTSTTNNLLAVFDIIASDRTQGEAWTTYTGWSPRAFAAFPTNTVPDLYFGDATTGAIYIQSGTSDNGVAIDADYQGKDSDFEHPELYKRFLFGYGSGVGGSAASIDFYSSVDDGPFSKLDPLILQVLGSRLGPTGSFHLGPTGNAQLAGAATKQSKFYFNTGGGEVSGKQNRMRIRHQVLNEQPTVNGFSVNYKERSLR